jgi:hypothetical protein
MACVCHGGPVYGRVSSKAVEGGAMRLSGTQSWQIRVGTNTLLDCALWIRAAERLAVPADPLVPGPLDLDRPPAPISTADEPIAAEWLVWWHSLVDPGARGVSSSRPLSEPWVAG